MNRSVISHRWKVQ